MNWTEKHIKELKAGNKIQGYRFHQKAKKYSQKQGKNIPAVKKHSKEKEWMAWNLMYWCNENALTLEEEFRFDEVRKWRFDWCISSLKIAIEYEGLNSEKSRHTTVKGFTGDADKYNRAQQLGWKVLRYTALNYKNLITDLNKTILT